MKSLLRAGPRTFKTRGHPLGRWATQDGRMVSLRYTSPSGCVLLDNTLEEWPSHGARLSLQFPAPVLQQRLVQNQRAQTGRCLWCPLLAPLRLHHRVKSLCCFAFPRNRHAQICFETKNESWGTRASTVSHLWAAGPLKRAKGACWRVDARLPAR